MLTVPLLTAAAMAGLLGGVHCAAMCGSLSSLLTQSAPGGRKLIPIAAARRSQLATTIALHSGRLAAYMSAGAVLGFAGQHGLLTYQGKLHFAVMLTGYLVLGLLGLRLTGITLPGHWSPQVMLDLQVRLMQLGQKIVRKQPYLAGIAWAGLPCGLLYSVAPLAIFSGDAISGAALMGMFGICALPHLLLSQQALRFLGLNRQNKIFSVMAGLLLLGLATYGIAGLQTGHMPDWLCVIPK